jgi:hypothetical protein
MARALVVIALLGIASPALAGSAKERKPILLVMDRVVAELSPHFRSTLESPRTSVGKGLFGIGAYRPPGGSAWGFGAAPVQVLPRAGGGVSLNLDPVTGKLY